LDDRAHATRLAKIPAPANELAGDSNAGEFGTRITPTARRDGAALPTCSAQWGSAPLGKWVELVIFWAMKTREITDKLQDWQQRATETAKNVGATTDRYVHENTWTSIACVAAVGCVIGFLIARGRD